jgi:hypothetical protein
MDKNFLVVSAFCGIVVYVNNPEVNDLSLKGYLTYGRAGVYSTPEGLLFLLRVNLIDLFNNYFLALRRFFNLRNQMITPVTGNVVAIRQARK